MRFKSVPPPPDSLVFLERAQAAVPLVPEEEESCCVRLASRLEEVNRDEARSWLAFMRALGLAEAGNLGYVRTRRSVDPDTLRTPFVERIFGAREVLDHLETTGSSTADEAFEAIEAVIPQWERHRNPGTWATEWRDRVEYLLEWAALFELVDASGPRYSRRYPSDDW